MGRHCGDVSIPACFLAPLCSLLVIPMLARIVIPVSTGNAVALPPVTEPA
jgi:hypothetical protein